MDIEKTKQYLSQIGRLEKQIQNKLSEIYQLKAMTCSITVSSEKESVRISVNKDKLGSAVARIVDLEREANELVDSFSKKRQHIIEQIDSIENVDYYHVLSMRYVGQKSFGNIADATHWSIRKVFSLHDKALQEFERLYGHEYIENVQ